MLLIRLLTLVLEPVSMAVNVVAQGTAEVVKQSEQSITGQYLSGRKFIPVPKKRRSNDGRFI